MSIRRGGREDENFDARGTGQEGDSHDKQALAARILRKLTPDVFGRWASGDLTNDDVITQYGHLDE